MRKTTLRPQMNAVRFVFVTEMSSRRLPLFEIDDWGKIQESVTLVTVFTGSLHTAFMNDALIIYSKQLLEAENNYLCH